MRAIVRSAPGRAALLLLLALAGAGGGLAGALAWHLDRELTAARAENLALQQRLLALDRLPSVEPFQAEAKKWRERSGELEAQIAAAAQYAASLAAAPAVGAPAASPSAGPLAQMASILGNPTLRELVAAQQEKAVLLIFEDFFAKVRLAPVPEQRLLRMLVDKQMAQMDYGLQAFDPRHTAAEREALYRAWVAANAAADENIRGLLASPEDFALYQMFLQQQPERLEVSTLAGRLGNAGFPLTPAQRDALVALMYDARREFAFTEDFYDRASFNTARLNAESIRRFFGEQERLQRAIADRAAAVLGAEQMPAFRNNQAAMREFMRSQMLVAQEVMGAAP